jgi:hypothetical protein
LRSIASTLSRARRQPLCGHGRIGRSGQIAATAAHLADESGRFNTGDTILVDGDFAA